MPTPTPILHQQTLAELAVARAGASRVFRRHRLDFCCNGRIPLADACEARGLDPDAMIAEIDAETRGRETTFAVWEDRPLDEVIDHLLVRYHAPLREDLPRLLAMARKVEQVHADKPSVPRGLSAELAALAEELELHMQKEEQVLFPLIRSGRGRMATMPVHVMEAEHRDAGAALDRMRSLATSYVPPAEACATWKALYLGLEELEGELMDHISLENNILFPRALRS